MKIEQQLLIPKSCYQVKHLLPEALIIKQHFSWHQKKLLIVKPTLLEAKALHAMLATFYSSEQLFLFAVDEAVSLNQLASSPDLLYQRLATLKAIKEEKPLIVIAHCLSLITYLPTPTVFNNAYTSLSLNMPFAQQQLLTTLINNGYHLVERIEAPLQIAKRGDIIEVYSIAYPQPIRIEIAYNEIESIRFFDLDTYKSVSQVASLILPPGSDIIFTPEEIASSDKLLNLTDNEELLQMVNEDINNIKGGYITNRIYQYFNKIAQATSCFLDYFDGDLIISDYPGIKEFYSFFCADNAEYVNQLIKDHKAIANLSYYYDLADLHFIDPIYFNKDNGSVLMKSTALPIFNSLDLSAASIIKQYQRNYQITISLASARQQKLFTDFCLRHDIAIANIEFNFNDLSEGIILDDSKEIIFSKKELFNIASVATFTNFTKGIKLESYDQLNEGDYVVHETYGIGRFTGIKTKEVDNIIADYISIEYHGNDVLLIPVDSFHLVKKFKSREGTSVKLNSLSNNSWQKTKNKIIARITDLAAKLVTLYQTRSLTKGYAFPKDDVYQEQFEQSFPFTLTPGQIASVKEIKADMESALAMDRLLCGDVGFGKTEVAFRAAFKALNAGKQVLILCPTTLLARQHYQLAQQRFRQFTTSIALLSRLVSAKDLKTNYQLIKENKIKLIIATHQGLSNEISYPDLGLIIIDEEQRFGVEQKERIKMLKENIDVLALSATPIPRTLQFSLVGIRGLSQIDTPPDNRLPIQTYVQERSDYLIKEIISRELGRGGQVFYLINNITLLSAIATKLKKLFNVVIQVAHGRMDKNKLEQIMSDFYDNKIDILIATTIIESGLDIENANTIIIDNAHCFGLAQLYQIRGRVGRGARVGYCYLLVPPKKQLNEVAQKRLQAIKEFTELGSGYHIAMRDLTIRGAGDLLGQEQSGFIDSVGIELYLKLLKEALAEVKGETIIKKENLSIQASGYISDDYAGSKGQKFAIYKKIIGATTLEELDQVNNEIIDIHGQGQDIMFKQLLIKRQLEILIQALNLKVSDERSFLRLTFDEEKSLNYYFYNNLNAQLPDFPALQLQRRNALIKLVVDKSFTDWLLQIVSILRFL